MSSYTFYVVHNDLSVINTIVTRNKVKLKRISNKHVYSGIKLKIFGENGEEYYEYAKREIEYILNKIPNMHYELNFWQKLWSIIF